MSNVSNGGICLMHGTPLAEHVAPEACLKWWTWEAKRAKKFHGALLDIREAKTLQEVQNILREVL